MKDLAPGDLIAGKYRLERLVGRGGMGSVWAARNEQLGMLVALKFIDSIDGTEGADARQRFEREAKAAAQIRSPHVAQIIDHGVDGDRPFIAMELLEGEDLGERLRREGRLSVPAMARILGQAAKALRRAHEAGIIHRDLKPGNIFLARFDDDELVKLLDFGVAKMQGHGAIEAPLATQTGIVFGSPSYMSPEQARGQKNLDHRSDLWSLAVIVFRAITGVKPFQAAAIGDLVVKLCIDPLPVATAIAPDLPPEIDRFFERAFARDPQKRFGSAVEMAAAFEAIAAYAPAIVARAPGPPSARGSLSGPSGSDARAMPAPPLPAPASQPWSAPRPHDPPPQPMPPVPGSGPHVAFAPGTLTPPPGSVPEVQPIPAPPSFGPASPRAFVEPPAVAPMAPAPSSHPAPPIAAAPYEPAPVTPPPGVPSLWPLPHEPTQRSAIPQRKVVLGAVLGAVGLVLLVAVIFVAARSGGGVDANAAHPAASAPEPPPSAEPAKKPEPPAPADTASAAPIDPPAPTASASASAPAEPSADVEPSAKPKLPTKPGKKKPNFGY
jgi:serine/threonine-protein kinase